MQKDRGSRVKLAYDSTKELIRSGEFSPGSRLRELDLAERLGISRTPVREAVNRLLSEGLLTLNPNGGFSVVTLGRQQVQELYALREFLEGAVARHAAQHASISEIEALEEMLDRSQLTLSDASQQSLINRQFHRVIGIASHNRYMEQALTQMSDSLELVPRTSFEVQGRAEEVLAEHGAILDSIRKRDADQAECVARVHIQKASHARLKLLFGSY